jgi:hypothetical protein
MVSPKKKKNAVISKRNIARGLTRVQGENGHTPLRHKILRNTILDRKELLNVIKRRRQILEMRLIPGAEAEYQRVKHDPRLSRLAAATLNKRKSELDDLKDEDNIVYEDVLELLDLYNAGGGHNFYNQHFPPGPPPPPPPGGAGAGIMA